MAAVSRRRGIVLPMQAGVKTKVFALFDPFWPPLLAVIESKKILAVFKASGWASVGEL